VSAHGYAEARVAKIKQVKGLSNNDAVLSFLREYCLHQRDKKRKTIGIRMILSFDPEKVTELAKERVDIDQLLVSVAEKTFDRMAEVYYPGDQLGFVLALHHDAETYKHTTSRRRFIKVHGREPGPEDCKPHIHAHLLVLSHTRNDQRVNFSDRSLVDRSAAGTGERLDRLTAIREYYQAQVTNEIYHYRTKEVAPVDPAWVPLIREAATCTLEDFAFKEPEITDRKELRRRVVNRYNWYLATTDREKLEKRYQHRRAALLDLRRREAANSEKFQRDAKERFAEMNSILGATAAQRAEAVEKMSSLVISELPPPKVRFFDTPSETARVEVPANHIPKYEPDRSEELKKLMGEFDSIRHVTRIQTLGEVTLLSLRLQAATRNPEDPEWLSSMGDTAQLDALPNQTLPEPSPDWAPNYPAPVASTSSGTGTKKGISGYIVTPGVPFWQVGMVTSGEVKGLPC
jgi:hypothetical protein